MKDAGSKHQTKNAEAMIRSILGGKALEGRLADVSAPAGVCDRFEQSAEHPTNHKKDADSNIALIGSANERLLSGQEVAE